MNADTRLESEGHIYHLRGHASIEGAEVRLTADEIDYNEDTADAEARGNVTFHQYAQDEEVHADRVLYNTREETGKFYNVRGWSRTHVVARPGVLTSNSPLYFEGEWAERIEDKYILHNGMVTNCKLPNPWWTLRGPVFDIIPDDHAVAHRSVFRLKWIPLFYTPYFYKSLEKLPRKSGFLIPNIGHSSIFGYLFGLGYYWAINRSYDLTYRFVDYTARGFGHHVDLRGKPTEHSDFDALLYGVQDRGVSVGNGQTVQQGGFSIYATGKADLGDGWYLRGTLDYLSSLTFRQAFTQSFNEAIFSQSSSVAFLAKKWSSFSFETVVSRVENFQSTAEHDTITVRKLPEFDFSSRDRQILSGPIPIWVSFDSSAGWMDRSQLLFQTAQFMNRDDVTPRVTTAFDWKGFHLVPSFSVEETHYGEQQQDLSILGRALTRSSRQVNIDLIAPSLERTFNRKTWLGDKIKHVIEPRISYKYVNGVDDFNQVIRFDAIDLVSNTNQLELSLTNRIYAKRGNDVSEVFSWQLWQQRYFDPTFGGAVLPGERNVVLSSVELTPYAFLNGPRNYSPVVSVIRASPRPGWAIEWRSDYDPLVRKIVDSGFTTDFRKGHFFVSAGHSLVSCRPLTPADAGQCQLTSPDSTRLLSPKANQVRGRVGWGDPNHRGWNAAFDAVYDYRLHIMQFATAQVTYNTDCCGISVQYRRFDFGFRNETQFLASFSVANMGSFGTLRKQERLF
ncbi:MAG TPA: LPS assembly protein LptD [Bryobacteraceae bacterium]|nr:LPS assembly protein LptD [Bryobacteraceae bacterium]